MSAARFTEAMRHGRPATQSPLPQRCRRLSAPRPRHGLPVRLAIKEGGNESGNRLTVGRFAGRAIDDVAMQTEGLHCQLVPFGIEVSHKWTDEFEDDVVDVVNQKRSRIQRKLGDLAGCRDRRSMWTVHSCRRPRAGRWRLPPHPVAEDPYPRKGQAGSAHGPEKGEHPSQKAGFAGRLAHLARLDAGQSQETRQQFGVAGKKGQRLNRNAFRLCGVDGPTHFGIPFHWF